MNSISHYFPVDQFALIINQDVSPIQFEFTPFSTGEESHFFQLEYSESGFATSLTVTENEGTLSYGIQTGAIIPEDATKFQSGRVPDITFKEVLFPGGEAFFAGIGTIDLRDCGKSLSCSFWLGPADRENLQLWRISRPAGKPVLAIFAPCEIDTCTPIEGNCVTIKDPTGLKKK